MLKPTHSKQGLPEEPVTLFLNLSLLQKLQRPVFSYTAWCCHMQHRGSATSPFFHEPSPLTQAEIWSQVLNKSVQALNSFQIRGTDTSPDLDLSSKADLAAYSGRLCLARGGWCVHTPALTPTAALLRRVEVPICLLL